MNTPALTITFLGTGTSGGVPMIACGCPVCSSTNKNDKRLRSSILVKSQTTAIVVDTTPDFRYQMLRQNIKNIDAILFTHPHKDHVAGLDDIKAFNYINKKPVQVYANEGTQKALKNEFHYIFAEHKYPGVPEINLHLITDKPFVVGDISITPILVWHFKMPVLGFRFGNFTYITDANRIDDEEQQKIIGSSVLVLNALRHEPHLSHFTLAEAVQLATSLQIPQTYFTHISHQLGFHDEVNQTLPKHCNLAYDGLVCTI